ncbi:hypothetical protein K435DRAFT_880116 [Dendrothele bispora CBS 962.96]|uniref:Uncharacterized protein n=1 Tax=Dendrothele bispora (strain CBS 962.96) TaxID=1314807 RepID=A0A4S8KK56_DENBC|nr:hypothetical protein K435DRAFT_880116 [Dendrothele bispora CBS 962.96]
MDHVQGILLPLLFGYPWSKAVTDLLQSRTQEFGSERDLSTSSKIHRASSSFHSILRLTYDVFSKLASFSPYYLLSHLCSFVIPTSSSFLATERMSCVHLVDPPPRKL